ncbi:MAG: tripartite tricarboxylate transporter substrate binding protein [Betaproteobacteria bacterium]|nr:tripartite tricarboxylate transporter substrate binding protein [Betaproteobacteria bacterium]
MLRLLATLFLGLAYTAAWSQGAWRPEKQVEIIVPTAPGGGNDTVARLLAKALQDTKALATPAVVMNKSGGNQTVSLAYLAQQKADPHYLLLATSTFFTNHIQGLSQHNYRDFPALALAFVDYSAFMVPTNSPFKTFGDMIQRLKTDPESVAFSVVARGGTSHAVVAMAAKAAGIDPKRLKIVVFKTSAEATTAMMGGHIQAAVSSAAGSTPPVSAGQLRMLAIAASQRRPGELAHVPTLAELGLNAPVLATWRCIFGARGISQPQIAFWEDALAKAFQSEDWKAWMTKNDVSAPLLRGAELVKYLDGQYTNTRGVLLELGLAK